MISGVLGLGRRMAEGRMLDVCRVERVTGSVLDEATGQMVDAVSVVFSGPCRVVTGDAAGRDADSGGRLVAVTLSSVHLPVSAVGVRPGDRVVLVSSGTRDDLDGRRFVISAAFDASQTTALRFRVEVDDGLRRV